MMKPPSTMGAQPNLRLGNKSTGPSSASPPCVPAHEALQDELHVLVVDRPLVSLAKAKLLVLRAEQARLAVSWECRTRDRQAHPMRHRSAGLQPCRR